MSNIVDWAIQGADAFKAFCITSGYREQINEGLWDWLDANGYTQATLNDKIKAATADGFDFSVFGTSWSPDALFASGEQGVWYDPSDLTTMFQDSAGTTPVTATGQPVGLILDKSGRGNHATQSTTSYRPVLQQDGSGHYYLAFDGVDDRLQTAAIDFTATNKMSCFAGWYSNNDSYTSTMYYLGGKYTASGFMQQSPWQVGANLSFDLGGATGATMRGPRPAAPFTGVVSWVMDRTGATVPLQNPVKRLNGAVFTSTSESASIVTGNFGNLAFIIGGVSEYLSGRIYSSIVRSVVSSTQEIDDTEAWVNGKTGAY